MENLVQRLLSPKNGKGSTTSAIAHMAWPINPIKFVNIIKFDIKIF